MAKLSHRPTVSGKKQPLLPATGKKDAYAGSLSPCSVAIHPGLKDFVGYACAKLGFRIRQRMEELLVGEGLVAPQAGILRLLQTVGPMTQVELGQHMLIDKATMVRMLDGLEERGYAVRNEHAEDRRAKVLTITAKGAKILDKVKEARIKAEGEALAPLAAKEQAEFRRLLQKLWQQEA